MPLGVENLALIRAVMHRARRGLYAGRGVGFGNKVSEDGGNKTRRMWRPNTQYKRLFSHVLDGLVRVRVTTHSLRCIDKAGGIDEYLLKTPDEKLNSDVGVMWKRQIELALQARREAALQSMALEGGAEDDSHASQVPQQAGGDGETPGPVPREPA